jgi:hypothetical protein
MKNAFRSTIYLLLAFLFHSQSFAQLIMEKSASQVSLSSVEQQFVQKITQQADTKTAKFISIGDIATYETNGMVIFTLPGLGILTSEAVHVEYQSPTDNPSTFLSNQPSITLNTPFCEPSFWLQLTVTSADGLTRTSRRRVGIVEECPHFQGEVEDRGLKNNQIQNLGKIYPNPTKDKFDILIAPFEGKCTEIILSDNFGRLVKHIKSCESGSIEIPVETLPHGTYFVSVRSESKIETHKLIIQN